MNLENKSVLVVGGCGFIGSHVADELTQRGAKVTIYDTSAAKWINGKQKFVSGDLQNTEDLNRVTQGMDYVYHFAAIADIGEATEKRVQSLQTNIMGSINLIEACLKNKVKTFVFASSVYVYSDKGSFYRIAKQAVELLIEEYSRLYNLDYRILRYGSLYGPRSQQWNGLRKYVQSSLRDGHVKLKSQGQAKREYVHVHDAARLSVDTLKDSYKNRSLVITGNTPITAHDLIHMLSEILNKEIKIQYEDSFSNDHYITTPYRFVPKVGMRVTTNDTIDFGQGLLELVAEIAEDETSREK